MGADLIGLGYTIREGKPDEATMTRLIEALSDEWLEANIEQIDPSGMVDFDPATSTLGANLREYLLEGADAFLNQTYGRLSQFFGIPGTPLYFIFTGDVTWGDPPFEGFDGMCMFLEAAALLPELADAARFICGGLPDAQTIAQLALISGTP